MPEQQLHPLGVDGWEYQEGRSFVGYGVTLHGHRADTPAGLPLVTSWGPTHDHAIADLRRKARDWDREAA